MSHESKIQRLPGSCRRRIVYSESGCWEWCGCLSTSGYGQFNKTAVHRYTYAFFRGPLPKGKQMDHLCRNRRCCNPWHVEPVTPLLNNLRGVTARLEEQGKLPPGSFLEEAKKRLTHCKNGHRFTKQNLRVTPGGKRICRKCHSLNNTQACKRENLSPEKYEQVRAAKRAQLRAWRAKERERQGLPPEAEKTRNKRLGVCKRGHPRTPENLLHRGVTKSGEPRLGCRLCKNLIRRKDFAE